MLVTLGYYPGDLDQAERLANWIKELDAGRGHRLLVARDGRTPAKPFADVGFDRVDEIIVTNDVWNGWPHSANNVFRQIVTYIELVDKAPYHLWLEPDVVLFTRDAFDTIEREYLHGGKPFMGDLVDVNEVPLHMSGIGVYPGNLTRYAGEAKLAVETAWDVHAKDQIVPQMYTTDRILHAWKHPTFEDWASVEREVLAIKPDVVLFHASKDGSLIKLLRDKRNGTLPVSTPDEPTKVGERAEVETAVASHGGQFISTLPVAVPAEMQAVNSGTPTESTVVGDPMPLEQSRVVGDSVGGQFISSIECDILIKSYPQDYDLLKYCLRSIQKFAHGFKNLVVVVPEGHWPNFVHRAKGLPDNLKIQLVPEKPEDNGYLFQQTIKANAHLFTVSPYVLHIDSDTVFTQRVTPETFLRDGKPLWFVTPYDDTQVPWKASTEKFIGHEVEWEYMRRLPMFIPRVVHETIGIFCEDAHKKSLGEYIMGQPEFSEFNVLGAIAWDFFHDDISWFDTSEHPESEWPPLVALQTWSHGDHAEIIGQFETILSGGVESRHAVIADAATSQNERNHSVSGVDRKVASESSASPAQAISGAKFAGLCPAAYANGDEIPAPRPNEVIPWQNQLESEQEIKRLVRELRKFQTSPAYTNRVRMELKLARVMPGKKAIKRMKVRRRRLGGIAER